MQPGKFLGDVETRLTRWRISRELSVCWPNALPADVEVPRITDRWLAARYAVARVDGFLLFAEHRDANLGAPVAVTDVSRDLGTGGPERIQSLLAIEVDQRPGWVYRDLVVGMILGFEQHLHAIAVPDVGVLVALGADIELLRVAFLAPDADIESVVGPAHAKRRRHVRRLACFQLAQLIGPYALPELVIELAVEFDVEFVALERRRFGDILASLGEFAADCGALRPRIEQI